MEQTPEGILIFDREEMGAERNIIERLGGRLVLESVEGEGTTARIIIPFDESE